MEDNQDVLYNLKLTLEFNNYAVATAENGIEALKVLSNLEQPPDIIVSDIMMPSMNGYDFFKKVSENLLWNRIPFIFLTARTSPKDIRFGKMLGVDDYIVKPFKEEDLLASIAGKITRNKKAQSVDKKVEELISTLTVEEGKTPAIAENDKSSILLVYVLWDDKNGPLVRDYCPAVINLPLTIQNVGFQLFNGVASIYGQSKIHEAQGILLNIENIHRQGYIYFDSIPDAASRGSERPYMLGVIAPKINYFESLKIREVLRDISSRIKGKKSWALNDFWELISKILLVPGF